MKFICIADVHLSLYSQDNIIEGIPRRMYYINKVLNDIAQYAKDNNIQHIAIAGDTFHTKSIIHSLAQSMLLDYVRSHPDIIFIIIDGNHDMSSKSGDGVSALKCLDNEPNVIMIHETREIGNISFVPWHPKKMKKDIKDSKMDYLVSHFGLNEAMLNSGISIVSDIGMKDLKHFKKCFIGHYHLPQEIGNVIIPGSIIQLDWGEKGEKKRFLVIDSKKHTIESVLTKGYQKHVELEIDKDNKDEVLKEAKKLKKQGHFIKLLKIDETNFSDIEDSFQIVDRTIKDITNRGINSSMSTEDKLKSYLKIKEIPEEYHDAYIEQAKIIIDSIGE